MPTWERAINDDEPCWRTALNHPPAHDRHVGIGVRRTNLGMPVIAYAGRNVHPAILICWRCLSSLTGAAGAASLALSTITNCLR